MLNGNLWQMNDPLTIRIKVIGKVICFYRETCSCVGLTGGCMQKVLKFSSSQKTSIHTRLNPTVTFMHGIHGKQRRDFSTQCRTSHPLQSTKLLYTCTYMNFM